MKGLKFTFILGFVVLLVSACGGGDGYAPGSCDTPLTTSYVDNELTTEVLFTSHHITPSNTKLIHEDANQGKTYDINRIMLSNISSPEGDTLALSYSVYATQGAPTDSFIAFYIDTDRDATTGGTFGAEELILDPVSHGSGPSSSYYTWSEASSIWVAGGVLPLASSNSAASYFAGCSLGLGIFIPWQQGLTGLNLTNARGILMLTTFNNFDPGAPNTPIDVAGPFDFSFP